MNRKPLPLYGHPVREHCPVCGEVSYSAAGIHPQCAVQQADAKRMKQAKPRSKSLKKVNKGTDVKPWQRSCPRCKTLVHVRKLICACGYAFRVVSKNHTK